MTPNQGDAEEPVTQAAAGWDEHPPADERPALPRIAGYKLHAVLGRGATGIVYRATQLAVERQVALKVLHPELVPDRRAILRLQREARLAARLAHPSIISAIDMGEIGGRWWYAMELVEGVSLQRRLATRGPMSERECLRLFSPLCDALQHSHEVGVVHRDIKPANILIDRRGRARLVDLGLAMSPDDPAVTRVGGTLGTPHYVSPEQARDPRRADTRSDLWSLGATMYHSVTGRPPFEGNSVAEILSGVLHEAVPDPREFAPDLSKGFALMLGKCLTRDPERRYQEPWELVADIELLRERRRPDVQADTVDPFRSRRPAWLAPVLAGLSVIGLVATTWFVAARPWEPPTAERRITRVEDWPELVRVRDTFRSGSLSPAAALAELEAPTLFGLPAEAQLEKSALISAIKFELDTRVVALLRALDERFVTELEKRDFTAAARIVEVELEREVQAATGFDGVLGVPPGSTRFDLEAWARERSSRVADGRRDALERARRDAVAAYPETLGAAVATELERRDWRTPWRLLEPGNSAAWLERLAERVDLRGLSEDERRMVVESVAHLANRDRATVLRSANDALGSLRRFIDDERDRWFETLPETLQVAHGARLRDAFERERERLGIDPERVPEDWYRPVQKRLELAIEDLESEAETLRDELAFIELERHTGRADLLRSLRHYDQEVELWRALLAEPWRSSTHGVMAQRLHEAELLESLLRAAGGALAARTGNRIALTFDDRIQREGELAADAASILSDGFELKLKAQRLRCALRRSAPGIGAREDRIALGTDEIVGLALAGRGGVAALAAPTNKQVAVAAFLLAEGRPSEARAALRALPGTLDDALASALDARADRALGESPTAPAETATAAVERNTRDESFEAAYGVPNLDAVSQRARLVFDLATPEHRAAWKLGSWRASGAGLVLSDALVDDARFLAADTAPTLALVSPLRLDSSQELRVRLTLRVDAVPARGALFAITFAGYHLVLREVGGQARAWFGTGDLWTLVERVAQSAESVEVPGFSTAPLTSLGKGRSFDVIVKVRLSGGRLGHLEVDGQRLAVSTQYSPPAVGTPTLVVRSREAATLESVELVGRRELRR